MLLIPLKYKTIKASVCAQFQCKAVEHEHQHISKNRKKLNRNSKLSRCDYGSNAVFYGFHKHITIKQNNTFFKECSLTHSAFCKQKMQLKLIGCVKKHTQKFAKKGGQNC